MARSQIKKINKLIGLILRMIPRERQAHDVYRAAAEDAPTEMARHLFKRLADDELGHETKLRAAMNLLEEERQEPSNNTSP